LWYDEGTDRTTNTYRSWFIEEASKLYPIFEGGFFYIDGAEKEYPKYSQYKEMYKGLIIHKRISMNEYLDKIKKSAVVFNTPSVCGCHGWKLCEFLAMGKAIISTPLSNKMPGDFLPNINYLEVNSKEEIHNAILYFQNNPEKRKKMEIANKKYFEEFLSPVSVVKRIINQL
jgi:glycosyltransferase involved in cell wall biosynthesis